MTDDSVPSSIRLTAADGVVLAGEVVTPVGASMGVVCTHPHPLYGGDMHHPVTTGLFRAAADRGLAAVRFDFRGGGRSGGRHAAGIDERLDVVAAIDHLASLALPVMLAGYSFGADVALAVDHPAVVAWFAVAPPLQVVPADEMVAARDPRPTFLAVPEHDQFRPPNAARDATADWIETEVAVVAMADHFLAGSVGRVVDLFETFCGQLLECDR